MWLPPEVKSLAALSPSRILAVDILDPLCPESRKPQLGPPGRAESRRDRTGDRRGVAGAARTFR